MENSYKCDICKKYYKTYQTLWKHNKQFHQKSSIQKPPIGIHKTTLLPSEGLETSIQKPSPESEDNNADDIINDNEEKIYYCKYCKKEYKHSQNKYRHQKKCKNITTNKLNELEKQNKELKMMLSQIIRNKGKVQQKTLDRMKNKLIEYNQNNNSGSIHNGNVNNYNINIIALGNENIGELLTQQEKLHILNQKYQALVHFIKTVHFNDRFPQFKNVAITNNRTNEMHVFDPTTNTFKILDKDEQTANLIEYRICDLEDFYGELEEKLDDKTRKILDDVFDKRGENKETKDKVKLLVYNNSDCVTIKS